MIPDVFGLRGIAIASGLSLAVGTFGGWRAHSVVTDAKQVKAMEHAQAAHIEALNALQIQLDTELATRRALAAQLEISQSNVRTVTKEVIREIPKYIKDSTETCDRSLSPEFGRLYNRSIGIPPSDSDSESQPTGYRTGPVQLAGGNADE